MFGDKINLTNSTNAESQNAEIVAIGENNAYVSWWETRPITGSSESVLRISTDAGQTFGPVVMLGTNGTISTTTTNSTTNYCCGRRERSRLAAGHIHTVPYWDRNTHFSCYSSLSVNQPCHMTTSNTSME